MTRAALTTMLALLASACGVDAEPVADAGATVGSTASGPAAGAGSGGAHGGSGGMGGAPSRAACIPGEAHGDLLHDAPEAGMSVYAACQGAMQVIEHPGSVALDAASLSAFKEAHSDALFAIAGIIGHGTSLCCPGSDALCILLTLQTHTTPIEELPAQLAAVIGDEDVCVAFLVEKLGYEEPRCEPDDALCVPFPMCPDATDAACCPAAAVYDPSAPRKPDVSYPWLSEGACTHDGECVPNGCGQYCNAYTVPGTISTCECYPELATAFCGCVDGGCAWFYQ